MQKSLIPKSSFYCIVLIDAALPYQYIQTIEKKQSKYLLGVSTLSVKSNQALREKRGLVKFYCMMNLLSKDMDIYDSIAIFQIINTHHSSGPSNHIRSKILVFYSSKNKSNFLMDLDPHCIGILEEQYPQPTMKPPPIGSMGPPNVGLGGYYFLTPLKHLENMIFYICYIFSLGEEN